MDIVERLRTDDVVWGVRPSLAFEAADEIERLRWENANMEKLWGKSEGTWMEIRDKQDAEIERLRDLVTKWQALEKEAAMYVEGVICVRSAHFTGKEPYVGWLGLGKALTKDYDDMKRMREALKKVLSVQPIKGDEGSTDIIALAKALLEIDSIARAALKEKE